MKIELKRISYNKRLSQETAAYAADIFVDGKKRGTVSNAGHGGGDRIEPRELRDEINAYAKTLPPITAYGRELAMNADLVLGDLLDKHLAAADLKRAMRGKILFIASNGKLYAVKGTVAPPDAKAVLNSMPFDAALVTYLEATKQ